MQCSLYNFLLVHIDILLKQIASGNEAKAFQKQLSNTKIKRVQVGGLKGSSTAMLFAGIIKDGVWLFVLDDQDEAGYFYNDLLQLLGDAKVLFYPSSYRRAIKYNQKDAANEILRTEVLTRLQNADNCNGLFVVTYPDAISEKVVSEKILTDNTIQISVGDSVDLNDLEKRLFELGMQHTDYVYEPWASLLCVVV